MSYRRLFMVVSFVVAGLGCQKTSIKVPAADGGVSDLPGPDASPSVPDVWVADLAVAQDLGPSGDSAVGPDAANDLATDLQAPADLARIPDSASDGGSPPPPAVFDAKAPPSEVSADLATDVPPLPKDVVLFTSKDFGAADARCLAATPGWLGLVSTFLAEDQKCWADTDCTYVSFGDSCGMICVLPMNQQRIGEFGTQVYNYATANCSSCPSAASYPACAAPRAVYCNAGRCEYKAS